MQCVELLTDANMRIRNAKAKQDRANEYYLFYFFLCSFKNNQQKQVMQTEVFRIF
jgi:hypothetical protein